MSFLAPLFLLGALAIAGPILFHLIRRTTREKTPFSTLMFLQPTPPRVTRRSRLENLWLLALRCLAIALLAIGFGRPFLEGNAQLPTQTTAAGKQIVLLLDTSASMRREPLWQNARERAEQIVREAGPADDVAVLAFDRAARTVVSFDDWRKSALDARAALVVQRLAGVEPGWAATHLDAAMNYAADLVDHASEATVQPREIVVISDLQEGSKTAGLQGREWAREASVRFETVQPAVAENASIQWLAESETVAPAPDAPPAIRLRATNAAAARSDQLQVAWAGADAKDPSARATLYVPAGQSRIVRAPNPPAGATALTLSGDDAAFDNTLFVLPVAARTSSVLFAGSDAEDDPKELLFYLRRAFAKTARESVEVVAHRTAVAIPAAQIQEAQLFIFGSDPPETAVTAAQQFAREGKIVLLPFTSAGSNAFAAKLLGAPASPTTEAIGKDFALFADIDFQHPFFAPFLDPRFSDFTKIHVWKHRRADFAQVRDARVLVRFDDRDPAVVQVPVGKGSVVIFTTTWRPGDSQLALSSKFVPLLHAMLEQSSGKPAQKAQYFVGDEVLLASRAAQRVVKRPDGTEVPAGPEQIYTATDLPGVYTVMPGGERFAVNLSPEESRVAPLTGERFASLGVPVGKRAGEESKRTAAENRYAQAAELESRQKLWRWIVVFCVGVLLCETVIAAKLSRHSRSSTSLPT